MFLIIMFLISKLYGIPKRQQNVLDMKLHYIYGMVLATSVQVDMTYEYEIELETKVHPKVRNHGYYRFHI